MRDHLENMTLLTPNHSFQTCGVPAALKSTIIPKKCGGLEALKSAIIPKKCGRKYSSGGQEGDILKTH